MQLVIAAITTWPWSSSVSVAVGERQRDRRAGPLRDAGVVVLTRGLPVGVARAVAVDRLGGGGRVARGERQRRALVGLRGGLGVVAAVVGQVGLQRLAELDLRGRQRDAVLRALGPGQRGHDLAEVELDRVREGRLLGVLVVPEPLLLGVGLDEVDELLRAARRRPGSAASRRRSGRSRTSSRTPGSCCRSSRGRPAAAPPRPGRRTRRTCPTTPFWRRRLGDRQDEVGRRRALGQLAAQPEAEDLRDQHRHRLAEHRRLGLDAARRPSPARPGR